MTISYCEPGGVEITRSHIMGFVLFVLLMTLNLAGTLMMYKLVSGWLL